MTGIHLFAASATVEPLLRWLEKRCAIAATDITFLLRYPDDGATAACGIASIDIDDLVGRAGGDDIVIAAGIDIDRRLASLFERGFRNVYDGNAILNGSSAAQRFLSVARDAFVGPAPPSADDPGAADALRFHRQPLIAKRIPRHLLFVVNSVPKSGTLWLAGLLGRILAVAPRDQIIVSHVADFESDRRKYNTHGAVTLVRDLRDVVVSWYHDSARMDRRAGFERPRYATIEAFYREFFIATMAASDRYYRGDLVGWIDRNCADYVPLVRYEDMHADIGGAVAKILNAWRISHDPVDAQVACAAFARDRLAETAGGQDDYVGQMFRGGHLRRGTVGSWRDELPAVIADDIGRRFADYQQRLGYL